MSWEVRKNGDPSGGSETILKAEEKLFVIRNSGRSPQLSKLRFTT
jgi:hypothetical protein